MRYFSTFSGIGGFELGIQNAYRETIRTKQADTSGNDEAGTGLVTAQGQNISAEGRRASSSLADIFNERPLCVGYSETDKYATQVYEYHFRGKEENVYHGKNFGDITKINERQLPDFDCLVGGFPCQAFSIAGKRRGFEDTRGTLFFDLARILRVKRPRLFVFENVKGLLNHDEGRTFRTIIATIVELGYDCQWQLLNSKDFGVPQNRERVIIVGHLRGTPRPKVFPFTTTETEDTRVVGQDVAYTIDANYHKGTNTLEKSRRSVIAVPEATKKGYAEASSGQAINLSALGSKTRRGRVSDISPTLDTSMQIHTATDDLSIRRLTPLECERLQGFPDNWTLLGRVPSKLLHNTVSPVPVKISDTQRYKMCGNAVTVNVIEAVFERIFDGGNN